TLFRSVFSSLTLDLNNFSSYLVCRLTATDVGLTAPPIKLPVAIKRSRRSHSVPADTVGLRKTPVHSTESGPVLRRVKVFVKHMHRGVPFIEELTRKHIPISVQQRPAPLFVKSLQPGDVLRVILQKVRVVLNLSRNEGVLSTQSEEHTSELQSREN